MRWKLEASLFCVKGSAHFKRLALLRSVGETPTWMIWFARKAFLGHIRELENVVPRFDQ
jgi:hypothetical protein